MTNPESRPALSEGEPTPARAKGRQFLPVSVTRFEVDHLRNFVVLLDRYGWLKDSARRLENWIEEKTSRPSLPAARLSDAEVLTICRRLGPTYNVPLGAMKWALGAIPYLRTSDMPDGTAHPASPLPDSPGLPWPTETERELAIGALISAEDDDEIDREWARVRELFARCESQVSRLLSDNERLRLDKTGLEQWKELAQKDLRGLRATALTPEEASAVLDALEHGKIGMDRMQWWFDAKAKLEASRRRSLSGETPK